MKGASALSHIHVNNVKETDHFIISQVGTRHSDSKIAA